MILIIKYFCLALISISFLLIFGFSFGSGKPFKHLFANAFLGYLALAVIILTEKFTGVHIAVNPYTVIGSGVFGIPAVCFFSLMDLILKSFI